MDNEIFSHAVTQSAMFLGLITMIIATIAWLLGRMVSAVTVRRLVWQVAILCVGALSLLELTGMSGVIGQWVQTPIVNQSPAAATTVPDNFALEPPPPERNSATDDFPAELEAPQADLAVMATPAPVLVGPLPLKWESAEPEDFPAETGQAGPSAEVWDSATSNLPQNSADSGLLDTDPLDAARPPAIATHSASLPERSSNNGIASALGFVWIIGVFVLIARALLGRALLFRFAAKLDAVENTNIQQAAREVAANLDCGRVPRLKYANSLAGPLAFGIFRPTLVLPRNFSRQFTPEGQRAVLVHEIAHLRQADPFWLLLADFICACCWWNPVVWLMRSRFRSESELAADEATTCLDDGPAHLASSLLRLGTRLSRPRAVGFVSANGLGLRSHLARRIERLVSLDENTCRPRQTRPFLRTLAAVCIIAGCLIGTAWARPRLPSGGDSSVSSIHKSWRTSFAGAALAALLVGSPAAEAQESGPPRPTEDNAAELSALETEIVDLIAANDAFRSRAAQDQEDAEKEFAAQLASMETTIDNLRETIIASEMRVDQLQNKGEHAAAEQTAARLDELRAELSQRIGQFTEVQADFRNRLQNRIAQDTSRMREQMNALSQRLDEAREQGSAPEELQRLEDRLALLRRSIDQGAARRRSETPAEDQDAARRRAPQDRAPRARDRSPEDDPSREEKIRLILQAAENLERAGLKEQADELRDAVRTRMGPPGVGPRRRGPVSDAEPEDAPPVRRGGVGGPNPPGDAPQPRRGGLRRPETPGDAPQARRGGVGGPNPPGDAPQGRRGVREPSPPGDAPQPRRGGVRGPSPPTNNEDGSPARVDRELLMLIRALQSEVNSLRAEVQELRQDMNRDDGQRRRVPADRGRRGDDGGDDPAEEPGERGRRRLEQLATDDAADDPGVTDQVDATQDQGDAVAGSDTADNGAASDKKDTADAGTADASDATKDSGDSPPNPGTADRRRQ